ncbi:hypothetical protein GCM10011513_16340 [Franconibacter daqui]|nr:hypothetical protein GCM10011513_16340 [Franconibacter daqui]
MRAAKVTFARVEYVRAAKVTFAGARVTFAEVKYVRAAKVTFARVEYVRAAKVTFAGALFSYAPFLHANVLRGLAAAPLTIPAPGTQNRPLRGKPSGLSSGLGSAGRHIRVPTRLWPFPTASPGHLPARKAILRPEKHRR